MKKFAPLLTVFAATSCQPDMGIQPVNITSSDFCEIQRSKLSWDVADTPQTIKGIRRFNAKWDSRCKRSPVS